MEARDLYLQPTVPVPICSVSQGTQPFVGPLASPEMVSLRPDLGVLNQLRFLDPDHFRAGMIYHSLPVWERDFNCSSVDLLEIVQDGVRVERFFTPYKGDFKGQFYYARRLLPFGLITPLFAHSLPISSVILLFIGLPLGSWRSGAKLELYLHPIWFFLLWWNLLSLASAMTKDF